MARIAPAAPSNLDNKVAATLSQDLAGAALDAEVAKSRLMPRLREEK